MKDPIDTIAGLLSKLPFASRFEGARAVARRELVSNLRSVRMIVITALLGLAIVGGSAGISALTAGGQGPDLNNVFFVHVNQPAAPNGTHALTVFVSDVYGRPHAAYHVELAEIQFNSAGGPRGPALTATVIGAADTGASGFVSFEGLGAHNYGLGYTRARDNSFVLLQTVDPSRTDPSDFSLSLEQYDLGQNGSNGHLILHAVRFDGTPLGGARVLSNGTQEGSLDAHGYGHVVLGPGDHSVVVTAGNLSVTSQVSVSEPRDTAVEQGPNFILYIVAIGFVPFIVPIAVIAIAHDAVARERANGSIDFVLSRPATRRGVLLGKFLGSSIALLIPVYVMLLLGAMAIGAIAGQAFSWSFLGAIYLSVTLYVASYSLLLLLLSTLAKTTGTAIMFGILLWVLYNILWGVIVFLVTAGAGMDPSSPGYASVTAYTGLFNLNELYTAVVTASYPGIGSNPFVIAGAEILPSWGPLAASLAWLLGLFWVAMEVFDRKVAE